MFYWLLSIHTKHFISTFLNIFFFHPAEQKKQVLSAVSDMGNKKWMNNYVKIAWNFARGFDRMRKYLSRSQIKCSSPFILRYAVRTFIKASWWKDCRSLIVNECILVAYFPNRAYNWAGFITIIVLTRETKSQKKKKQSHELIIVLSCFFSLWMPSKEQSFNLAQMNTSV